MATINAMDNLTSAQRSYAMSRVRSENTTPELYVRRLVHALGYRFCLYRRDLPGVPDLVFPGPKKVIFVHGCFWHSHKCARGRQVPKSNVDYWMEKLRKTQLRDRRNVRALKALGWQVVTLWECELKRPDYLTRKIKRLLSTPLDNASHSASAKAIGRS
jgi:DNA mismatch endonuclease, patch repair protein